MSGENILLWLARWWRKALIAAVVLCLLVLPGRWWFSRQANDAVLSMVEELDYSAVETAGRISLWLKDMMDEGMYFSADPLLVDLLEQYTRQPGDAGLRSRLMAWTMNLREIHDLESVYLLDPAGETLMSASDYKGELESVELIKAMETLRAGRTARLEMYQLPASPQIRATLFVPLGRWNDGEGRAAGSLIMRMDALRVLGTLVKARDIQGSGSFTVFCFPGPDRLHFLDMAGPQLMPPSMPAVISGWPMPVGGEPDRAGQRSWAGEGGEYLAVLRPVAGAGWQVAAGASLSAVRAQQARRSLRTLGLIYSILIIVMLGIYILWRRNRERLYLKLYASEKKHRELLESLQEGIWIVDEDGRTTYVNPAMAGMLQYPAEEMAGRSWLDFMDKEWQSICERDSARRVRKIREQRDFQFRRKDGSPVWVSIVTAPVFDPAGNVRGAIAGVINIDSRKTAEQALARSESRLQMAFEVSREAIWEWERSTGTTESNPRFYEMLGYDPGSFDPSFQEWVSMIHPGDRPKVEKAMELLGSAGHEGFSSEFRLQTKNGSWLWILARVKVVGRDENGAPLKLVGTHADITTLKKTEAQLAAEKEHLAVTLRSIASAVITLDPGGRVVMLNEAAEKLTHWRQEEAAGKTLDEVIQLLEPEEESFARLIEAFQEEEWFLPRDLKIIDRQGRERLVAFSFAPIRQTEGPVLGSVLALHDMTGQRHLEMELNQLEKWKLQARSQQEWQSTFDAITDLISIHDSTGKILKANRAFMEQFGLKPENLQSWRCYQLFHATVELPHNCPFKTTIETRQPSITEVHDPDRGKTLLVSVYPYISPEGHFNGCIHVVRDITEKKTDEMRLIRSERLAALGQMASGIAHEINNPLATIAACAEGMSRRLQRNQLEPGLLADYLRMIGDEIERCKQITTSMLSFVRQPGKRMQSEVPLHNVIESVLHSIGRQERLSGIEVIRRYDPELPLLMADEGEIRQVLLILILNAVEAMAGSGILELETGRDDWSVWAKIGDSGQGISPELQNRIFEPFFTTKGEAGGTGLGLAIAEKIVQEYGGRLEVSSQTGRGAVFTLRLPRVPGIMPGGPGKMPESHSGSIPIKRS